MRAAAVAELLVAAACGAWTPAAAQLDGPIPDSRVAAGTLSFDGHATVGDFTGTTTAVSGEMSGGSGLESVRGWVEAPVATLVTGDKKRDRDLNKSMESEKYPTIRFELTGATRTGGTSDSAAATLEGRMLIHGESREVRLPAEVRAVAGGIRVRSDFPLNLKDYRIGGLSKMLGMLKMSEEIEVHVDLTFAPR
jgi:polyisoprenoid-binding protein YceI